jgi:uncharacterized membrane protein
MSTTTATLTYRMRPLTLPIRLALLLVVLAAVAAAFAIGHTTGHTTQVVRRVIVPSAPAPATHSSCTFRVGIPC